jgi:hypothetical protein
MKVKVSLNRMLAFSVVAALLTVSIFAMPTATTYAQTTTEGGAAVVVSVASFQYQEA